MNEARIVNSNFILLGGFGILIFNILCMVPQKIDTEYYIGSSFAYFEEQMLFLSICLILSICFPHSVEKVKQRDDRHQIRMEKMREKIEQQRTSSMRRKILGEDFKK